MKVTFWGVRGSLPCPLTPLDMRHLQKSLLREVRQKGVPATDDEDRFLSELPPPMNSLVGGNTSCVEVSVRGQTLILDAGSGIRLLGHRLMAGPCGQGQGRIKVFLSHTHWDHIQGLPYFSPLYVAGNEVEIYSGFKDIEARLALQQREEFFPLPVSALGARLSYHSFPREGVLDLYHDNGFPPGTRMIAYELSHPGAAYAYRLEMENASLVYAADGGYNGMNADTLQRYYQFFAGADLLIFDAQFSFREALLRREWGHATAVLGVNLAVQSGVKRLALYHHSTDYSDQVLYDLCDEADAYLRTYYPETNLQILLATEGLSLTLGY